MRAETIRQYCIMMATYNRNANQTLYEACGTLSEDALKADKGAFFGSIHHTLNHIMVGDDIWMSRFEKKPLPHKRLDAVPYDNFTELKAARADRDQKFITFFETVDDSFYEGDFHFTAVAGDSFVKPLQQIVAHFFNHQTHHRGQVHTLLTQSGVKTPVSDLPYLV